MGTYNHSPVTRHTVPSLALQTIFIPSHVTITVFLTMHLIVSVTSSNLSKVMKLQQQFMLKNHEKSP